MEAASSEYTTSACDDGVVVWLLQAQYRSKFLFKGSSNHSAERRRVLWLTYGVRPDNPGDLATDYTTTWTTGRNLLLQAAVNLSNTMPAGCGFLYYIFADGDIWLRTADAEGFETFLRRRRPMYGAPKGVMMSDERPPNAKRPVPADFSELTNIDGLIGAFHKHTLATGVLPYYEGFDSESWHYSQAVLNFLLQCVRNSFNTRWFELCVEPECSPHTRRALLNRAGTKRAAYPRGDNWSVPIGWAQTNVHAPEQLQRQGEAHLPVLPHHAQRFLTAIYPSHSALLHRTHLWLQRPGVAEATAGCGVDATCASAARTALLRTREAARATQAAADATASVGAMSDAERQAMLTALQAAAKVGAMGRTEREAMLAALLQQQLSS